MTENQDIIVGIDLGTTNSEVAVYRDGRVEVLTDEAGRKILPSVVGFGPDDQILVGEEARNQAILFPERTVKSIKRRMGTEEKIALGGRDYLPQEISAMILKRLKEIAEQRLGQPVAKAVITVPAYFSDTQRKATREAGEMAGLEVVRIINEPTAAALAYEAGHQQGKRILVYDLGGGTFDVSVVRIEQGVVEVLASHGNNHLGGDDFDQKLVIHILDHLKIKHGVEISGQPQAMARIARAAESAKKQLSDRPFVQVEEEYITEKDGQPVHLSLELTRDAYETMIHPFIEETLEAVHTALKGADLTVSQIGEILLVGGVTRTPMIQTRLKEVFGLDPHGEVDPDLCVAMGAGLQGAAIAGQQVSAVLVDVTPYTFGIAVLGMLNGKLSPFCYSPVILKNTAIPVQKSEVFFTPFDDQTSVDVKIYQGESRDAQQNVKLEEFTISGLSKAPAGNPLVIDLELDRDGILKVSAKEKTTGLQRQITIDHALRYDADRVREARERIDNLFGDRETLVVDSSSGAVGLELSDDADLQLLLTRASAKLSETGEEDRAEIAGLIESIRNAQSRNDREHLKKSRQQLQDIIFYLET